jgi:putative transposase
VLRFNPQPKVNTMTDETMATIGVAAEARRRRFSQGAVGSDAAAADGVEGAVGAGRHERSDDRTTPRKCFRERSLEPRLGTLERRIPKLRQGNYFPAFLEPRKTAERAFVASCKRHGSRASRPAKSMIWCRRWG